ncbi:hypothetical protein JTB14_027155 [Gonioctena quinquepunctata]|nr:hypothetical protein JTB14_027155 [Gonioctena quinquepunctata]
MTQGTLILRLCVCLCFGCVVKILCSLFSYSSVLHLIKFNLSEECLFDKVTDRVILICLAFSFWTSSITAIFHFFQLNMDMANAIIWDQINEDVEDAEIQNHIGVDVLPKRNPFELSEQKFIKMFRLTKALTRQLIDIVQHHVQAPSRASALTVETKVLATLRFLATGNIGELENMRQRFYEKYQFPGIVGIIDCTHVAIVSPKVHNEEQPERAYVNRKNYHSLNVQLICDSTLRILNVNARFPGSTHDAFIWSQSRVSETLERIYRQNPANTFFVIGDSGYPTRPWILTPIPHPETEEEERFNEIFRSIRSGIERCNGVIK